MSTLGEVLQGYDGTDPFHHCDTPRDAARLALDIALVAAEISEESGEEFSLYLGAREHCRRVGGRQNLRAYVACLRAGDVPR